MKSTCFQCFQGKPMLKKQQTSGLCTSKSVSWVCAFKNNTSLVFAVEHGQEKIFYHLFHILVEMTVNVDTNFYRLLFIDLGNGSSPLQKILFWPFWGEPVVSACNSLYQERDHICWDERFGDSCELISFKCSHFFKLSYICSHEYYDLATSSSNCAILARVCLNQTLMDWLNF